MSQHVQYKDASISCWAIRADRFPYYTPLNKTIPIISKKYVKLIKKVQPHGPYSITGWCFGGIRAFEIALQLENAKEKVGFLSLINSHVPIRDDNKRFHMVKHYSLLSVDMFQPRKIILFNEQSEKSLIKKWLHKGNLKWDQLDNIPYKYLWRSLLNHFVFDSKATELIKVIKEDVPFDRALAIPYYSNISLEKLLYYLAVMRTDANMQAFYIPNKKVKAETFYFAAKESLVDDREDWNNYTMKSVNFSIVPGTHFSIFHPKYVENFAQLFNKILIRSF